MPVCHIMTETLAALLHRLSRPEVTIALGDGVGGLTTLDSGVSIGETVSRFAPDTGAVSLILGWCPVPPQGLCADAFARIVTLMPGWGMRELLSSHVVHSIPTSMAAIPGLLAGHLRPDALITRMAHSGDGLQFCSEVSWQQALVDAGVPLWAVLDDSAPKASAEAPIPLDAVTIIGRAGSGTAEIPVRSADSIHDDLADRVLRFIPAGARLQYGPGQLGTALLRRTKIPLSIDTGLLTDAVIDLERRGLLVGQPSATYLLGSAELYRWADRRPILRGVGYTHDVSRLSRGAPFVAVNTAIEIDPYGQINVEGIADKVVGGIGGHPDYCVAARLSRNGLSIIAVPARFNGRSPLVERLSRPASTPAHDVDMIITEHAHVDLRGADWCQRHRLISELFDRAA